MSDDIKLTVLPVSKILKIFSPFSRFNSHIQLSLVLIVTMSLLLDHVLLSIKSVEKFQLSVHPEYISRSYLHLQVWSKFH